MPLSNSHQQANAVHVAHALPGPSYSKNLDKPDTGTSVLHRILLAATHMHSCAALRNPLCMMPHLWPSVAQCLKGTLDTPATKHTPVIEKLPHLHAYAVRSACGFTGHDAHLPSTTAPWPTTRSCFPPMLLTNSQIYNPVTRHKLDHI